MATTDTETSSFNNFADIGSTNIWSDAQLADAPLPEEFAPTVPRSRQLRDQRLDELLTSCREQVLQQIIGPFGLTPAMFNDKLGGNVTTQHNAEQDIFAKESEEYKRTDYDYASARSKKKREMVANGTMNSQEFTDSYTGQKAPTRRIDENGRQVMNAELDHTVPMKEAHRQGGWMKDKKGRKQISSEKDNLNYTTHETNNDKSAKPPEEYLTAENGFDETITQPLVEKAQSAIDKHLPTTKERVAYHGKELLVTGAAEAGKNALRQAMGVLMFEFVNGSYLEIAAVIKEPKQEVNLVDRVVDAMKRVLERVKSKMRDAFDALVSGGVQGFVSNFLTFIINNVITTSAKVVTIIRESIKGIWAAVKMIVSPPKGATGMDVARAATKLIAGVVTTCLGMAFEQSVRGFILSLPLLAPLADMLAPAVTGILTGVMTALTIFSIDRLFDLMSDKGTEYLEAQLAKADADVTLVGQLATVIDRQFAQSQMYAQLAQENQAFLSACTRNEQSLANAVELARSTGGLRADTVAIIEAARARRQSAQAALGDLFNQCSIN
ncbi:hypothetical protein [Paraburkholderia sacchari]|uniref:hypothetical protein n=1 Tax=Paraburkholderia sacchari TaxID=159450 RepID=UPI001BCD8B39|nr:hypothetical protein [Paraburkholderia sacchari]